MAGKAFQNTLNSGAVGLKTTEIVSVGESTAAKTEAVKGLRWCKKSQEKGKPKNIVFLLLNSDTNNMATYGNGDNYQNQEVWAVMSQCRANVCVCSMVLRPET